MSLMIDVCSQWLECIITFQNMNLTTNNSLIKSDRTQEFKSNGKTVSVSSKEHNVQPFKKIKCLLIGDHVIIGVLTLILETVFCEPYKPYK